MSDPAAKEVVERLRTMQRALSRQSGEYPPSKEERLDIAAAIGEAATLIEAQAAEIARVREELRQVKQAFGSMCQERDDTQSALASERETVKALREGLKPLAALADAYFYRVETSPGVFRESRQGEPDGRNVYGIDFVFLTVGDLRRARSLTQEGGEC